MNNRHLYTIALTLTIIGLVIFLFKFLAIGFPLTPDRTVDVWNVEAKISFDAENEPAKLSLFLPRTTHRFIVVNENFIARGYGLSTKTESGNRKAVWSIRRAKGRQVLYYRAVMQKIKVKDPRLAPPKKPEIEKPELDGSYLEAARSLFTEIHAKSADSETLVTGLIEKLNAKVPGENTAFLLGKNPTPIKRLEVARQVLELNDLPARIAHGILLERVHKRAPLIHWLEVYIKNSWEGFHPETGEAKIPENHLRWWKGTEPLAQITGGRNLRLSIAVNLNQEEAISATIERGRLLSPQFLEFSLFGLPIQTQNVYRVLLLIPIGAILLVFLRNVIGIKTFGTFMPILIALAFRETQLLWGIFLFTLVVALGLGVRFYLDNLKLLLVPRLASVLIVVVILMFSISIITHKLGLERGLSIALFPMVILTMMIERMCIVWEERGVGEALQQGIGSLLVAALTYLIMSISYVEHLVFVFPELLLVFLSGTLLMGRYSGYRLLELYRFKVFAKDKT
jgi:hypothetical protein